MAPEDDEVKLDILMKGLADRLSPEQREGAYAFASLLGALPNDSDGTVAFRVRLADVWEICLIRFSQFVVPLIPDGGNSAIEIANDAVLNSGREKPQFRVV